MRNISGDSVVCLKDFSWHRSRGVMFTKGNTYRVVLYMKNHISLIGDDDVIFNFCSDTEFEKVFKNKRVERKLKLEKINNQRN